MGEEGAAVAAHDVKEGDGEVDREGVRDEAVELVVAVRVHHPHCAQPLHVVCHCRPAHETCVIARLVCLNPQNEPWVYLKPL